MILITMIAVNVEAVGKAGMGGRWLQEEGRTGNRGGGTQPSSTWKMDRRCMPLDSPNWECPELYPSHVLTWQWLALPSPNSSRHSVSPRHSVSGLIVNLWICIIKCQITDNFNCDVQNKSIVSDGDNSTCGAAADWTHFQDTFQLEYWSNTKQVLYYQSSQTFYTAYI